MPLRCANDLAGRKPHATHNGGGPHAGDVLLRRRRGLRAVHKQMGNGPVLPVRLISRIATEMLLGCLVATRRTHFRAFSGGATYDRVILYLALLRHADCPLRGARTTPRAISIAGMAASLGQPFETLRRHVSRLESHGLVERGPNGIAIPAAHSQGQAATVIAVHFHDAMVAMVADLEKLGVPMPVSRLAMPRRPADTFHAALDLSLYSAEMIRPVYGTSLTAMVINAIITANVRALAYDPVLAVQYGAIDTIPPDHLRHPVTVASVARTLALPQSTVAREVKRLVQKDLVQSTEKGMIVGQVALARHNLTDSNRAATFHALRLVRRMRNGGFDFADPSANYINGRPPLASFG